MFRAFLRKSCATRLLTQGPVVLSVQLPRRRGRPVLLFAFVLIVLAVAGWFGDGWRQWPWWPQWLQAHIRPSGLIDAPKSAQQWQQENNALQQEIDRLLLTQKIEAAVHQQLEQQIATLQEQLNADELKLDFVERNQTPH